MDPHAARCRLAGRLTVVLGVTTGIATVAIGVLARVPFSGIALAVLFGLAYRWAAHQARAGAVIRTGGVLWLLCPWQTVGLVFYLPTAWDA